MTQRTAHVLILLVAIAIALPLHAEVRTGLPFQDNMVLQQGIPLPVWGTAAPGEKVTLQFPPSAGASGAVQTKTAVAGTNGTWRIMLDPLRASSDPRDMTLSGSSATNRPPLTLHGILVGEVWLCSGQSNMELPVKDSTNAAIEIARANYPAIRMLSTRGNRCWTVCTSNTVGTFSAVGYFFARELHTRLGVPVGIVNASQGATMIQLWMTPESAHALPILKDYWTETARQIEQRNASKDWKAHYKEAAEQTETARARWEQEALANDPGIQGRWFDPATTATNWGPVTLPMANADASLNVVGTVWFRRDVEIPESWVGKPLTLKLGPIDEMDNTYINGREVGRLWRDTPNFWLTPRVYTAPAEANGSRKVTVAVRVYNLIGMMGLFGVPEQWSLAPADDTKATPLPLEGTWRMRIGNQLDPNTQPNVPVRANPQPNGDFGSLFASYIAPVVPYGLKGVIWYQGESNQNEPALYTQLFPALIRGWRKAWEQDPEKGFPFYYVQLAGHQGRQRRPIERFSWAELRDAQGSALALPRTGVAVATDIGDAADIHPRNKQEVGKRLALWALAKDYSVKVECSGPIVGRLRIKGDQAILSFDHARGLRLAGDTSVGFAIAGADKVFHPATATVHGSTLVVTAVAGAVPSPVAVRYGWGYHPASFLYNAAGLPASPFRTDDWDAGAVQASE